MRTLGAVVVLAGVLAIWASAAPAVALPGPGAGASVVGGRPASIAEFPSTAYIVAGQGYGEAGCTGSVVAPRLVLTAGHCVDNIFSLGKWRIEDFRATTGVADNSDPPSADVSDVSATVTYPGFDPFTLHGDAGLLVLTQPVAAPPIALASPAAPVPLTAGTPLRIAGWGLTGANAYPPPTVLRAGTVAAQSPGYCGRSSALPFSPSLQICGIDPAGRAATCFGDSGGPAIVPGPNGTQVQVGIVSAGGPACSPAEPNLFTRVEAIAGWVQGWIAAVERGAPAPVGPQARLPRMTVRQATEIEQESLAEVLLGQYLKGREFARGCHRLGKAKARCDESWAQGSRRFFASVTSFWAIEENQVVLRGGYTIESADRRCLAGPHPSSCPVRTLSG